MGIREQARDVSLTLSLEYNLLRKAYGGYREQRAPMLKDEQRVRDPEKRSLVFEGEALEALEEIARREGKRLDEVVEEALSLKRWVSQVKEDGARIIVRRGRKDEYELVI